MMLRTAWGILPCLMLPICLGCSSTNGTVRGQNPADPNLQRPAVFQQQVPTQVGPAFYDGPPDYGPQVMRQVTFSNAMMFPESMGPAAVGSCPNGASCPSCLYGNGCGWDNAGLQRRGWDPIHNYNHSFKKPKNLVYPPANQPAAVVQYPYYTLKGPTDFFVQ